MTRRKFLDSGDAGNRYVTLLYSNDGGSFSDTRSKLTAVYNCPWRWTMEIAAASLSHKRGFWQSSSNTPNQ